MSFAPSSPVTGATQTGLTSPTYTLTADVAPDSNGKQYAVTALGGTQTGVTAHTNARPFTITAWKPRTIRILGTPNPSTGVVSQVPNNTFKVITRKGVTPLDGQPSRPMVITTSFEVPAGSDIADSEDIRAALSLHFGVLNEQSSAIGDLLINGVL